jgi:hypothetical protein
MMPQPPAGHTVIEGEIATYWLDRGVLVSVSKPIRRTVALIRDNATLVNNISGGHPVPLLIYLSNSPVPDRETRRFSAEMVPKIYSAMALVAPSILSRLVMNMVFGLKSPPIPTRSFTNEEAARQ